MGIFDGKLPREKDLDEVLVRRKIGSAKTAAVAPDDAMRLARIEYHRRPPRQRNPLAERRKMQVQPPVLAQEEIAES